MTNSAPPNQLIPSQTGLTLRRTDTLINLTHKLLAHTGVKGIGEMSDDELWEWWLGVDDEWKLLFLKEGLDLCLWQSNYLKFKKEYDYQADFDWLDRSLALHYIKQLKTVTELNLFDKKIQDISLLSNLTHLTKLFLWTNQIQDISLLSNLTHLTELVLWRNQIQNISALTNLIQLTRLNLQYNQVQDISALAHLIQLTVLGLGG